MGTPTLLAPPDRGLAAARLKTVPHPESCIGAGSILAEASPRAEARALLRMIGRNLETIDSIRSLIGVPANYRRWLLLSSPPTELASLERIFSYRERVLEEFALMVVREALQSTPYNHLAIDF